jgi:hypothetical protein
MELILFMLLPVAFIWGLMRLFGSKHDTYTGYGGAYRIALKYGDGKKPEYDADFWADLAKQKKGKDQ